MSTATEPAAPAVAAAPSRGMRFTGWAANYIDERTSASTAVKALGRKIFPDHWSFMLGEVALYSFVVILLNWRLDVPTAEVDVFWWVWDLLSSSLLSDEGDDVLFDFHLLQ